MPSPSADPQPPRAPQPAQPARSSRSEVLDVRDVPKPQRHGRIFARFEELGVGESFVLVNDHDPLHLRDDFERDQPGSFGWEYEGAEDGDWRVRISRLASTALPRVLVDTAEVELPEGSAGGAAWSIGVHPRDLDSNLVILPAGGGIGEHVGPDHDVLVVVLAGSGTITTERGRVEVAPGELVLLPRRSRRAFTAGPEGLRHLTVHRRRPTLQITDAPR
ncbi:DUF2249 domain-containing protein [Brachybacterium sp. ACRRE]|uniref:DUF2249 domain-containing protein n=1 Tax=Brachybacterium sp. ACRRE TaxID=2918184 RepID=UPI001EF3966D|nr:DUF2249 domain-containing protein [Brachybacterium sp. ACRRE]